MAIEQIQESPFGGQPFTYHRIESLVATRRVARQYLAEGWRVEVTVELGSYFNQTSAQEMEQTEEGPRQKYRPYLTTHRIMLTDLDEISMSGVYTRLQEILAMNGPAVLAV